MNYVGTSGYNYKKWIGNFYPKKINTSVKELKYYASKYNSVEINHTFYKMPTKEMMERLAKTVNKKFVFIIKVNKYFTHTKKLIIDQKFKQLWKIFWNRCLKLGKKLGALLFQFPSTFKFNTENYQRLVKLSKLLPKHNFVFEFRHESMFCEQIYQLMRQNKWTMAIININNKNRWLPTLTSGYQPKLNEYKFTTKMVYFRLHGSTGQYTGSYSDKHLELLAKHIKKLNKLGYNVYVYFNNTDSGNKLSDAITDSKRLVKYLTSSRVI